MALFHAAFRLTLATEIVSPDFGVLISAFETIMTPSLVSVAVLGPITGMFSKYVTRSTDIGIARTMILVVFIAAMAAFRRAHTMLQTLKKTFFYWDDEWQKHT